MIRLVLPSATALGTLGLLAAAPVTLAQTPAAPMAAHPATQAPATPPAAPMATHPTAAAPAMPPAAQRAAPARTGHAPAAEHARAAIPAGEPSPALQRAELAELGPKVRAEVERRATGGNTIRGVLETTLLNEIQLKDPASRIVALDLGRGTAVMQSPDQALRVVNFDKTTLALK